MAIVYGGSNIAIVTALPTHFFALDYQTFTQFVGSFYLVFNSYLKLVSEC